MRGYGHKWLCLYPEGHSDPQSVWRSKPFCWRKQLSSSQLGGSLFESVPGVLGWSWVSEIEKDLVILLYEAGSYITNKWLFLVRKLIWRILTANPVDLMQKNSFGVHCDWSRMSLRSEQLLSFTQSVNPAMAAPDGLQASIWKPWSQTLFFLECPAWGDKACRISKFF